MEFAIDKRAVLRQRSIDKEKEKAEKKKFITDNLRKILKKEVENRTKDDKDMLEQHKTLAKKINKNIISREEKEDRKREWEDDTDVLKTKCAKLAEAIRRSKRLVVYTGAGISTSANIPDYRGPNGIWTLLDQGKEIAACDLGLAQPTTAHMALFMLYKQGKISHVVSQNCDGLHLRSGIPRCKISEVHGNMFIEVCKECKPVRPYVRLFDVTERTNRHRHSTMRRCYICGSSLQDTIVHFGERGSIAWPINWQGASKAAEKADMILCLGSSLKVLRRYPWLWCMDRPGNKRPPLYIVNLQWTPKDATATMKINGRCDFVLAEVLQTLKMKIPDYTPYNDPLLSYATHLHEKEEHTTSRRTLIESKPVGVTQLSMTADVSPNGVITEVRVKNKFTTANTEFQHLLSEAGVDSTDTEPETEKNIDTAEEPADDDNNTSDIEVEKPEPAENGREDDDAGDETICQNGHHSESGENGLKNEDSVTEVKDEKEDYSPESVDDDGASDIPDHYNEHGNESNGVHHPDLNNDDQLTHVNGLQCSPDDVSQPASATTQISIDQAVSSLTHPVPFEDIVSKLSPVPLHTIVSRHNIDQMVSRLSPLPLHQVVSQLSPLPLHEVMHHNHQDSPLTSHHDSDDGDTTLAASNKKPKLESLSDCDNEGYDPLGNIVVKNLWS